MSNNNQQIPTLTRESVSELINLYRISTGIRGPEQEAAQQTLSAKLVEHAPELFGCWLAVQNEYNPLIQRLVPVVSRVIGEIDRAHQAQAQAKQPESGSNIIVPANFKK